MAEAPEEDDPIHRRTEAPENDLRHQRTVTQGIRGLRRMMTEALEKSRGPYVLKNC